MASAISLNRDECPDFSHKNTLKRVVLNYASLGENSNKFYIMELQEGKGEYPFRIYTEYGRMGKSPRKEGRYFPGVDLASIKFDDILSRKERKGYKPIEVDDGFNLSPSTRVVSAKKSKVDLSLIDNKVLKLIGKIYQGSTQFLITSINTPLGKLTANQVAKGLEILKEIEDSLDNRYNNFEYLSNSFYSIIPVIFGSKVDYNKFIIDDYYKLNEKKDLLGVMNSVVNIQKDLESTLEEKYKALNIKLESLSKRTKEYKRIVEKVQSTKGNNHHFDLEIKEIYKIEDMVGYKEFNPYSCTTMELFHGSRNQNILGILQNGLEIKPKSAIHTGSMFGSAIYFADSSTKSANYCWGCGNSYFGTDEHFMFLCDVATGKVKEYEDAQPYLTSAPYGYNSVMGKKGRSLIHNEYMVYHKNQVKLKYIIEFCKKN